jgi:hypothetical protein
MVGAGNKQFDRAAGCSNTAMLSALAVLPYACRCAWQAPVVPDKPPSLLAHALVVFAGGLRLGWRQSPRCLRGSTKCLRR